MSERIIQVMAISSGIVLSLAGILFPIANPFEPRAPLLLANALAGRQIISYTYVTMVVLSNTLFSPLLLLLTVRLYKYRLVTAIVAGSFLGIAFVLETVAALISLARWVWIIPVAAKGEPNVLLLFQTFQTLWQSIALLGALLLYLAGTIYALGLWRMHQSTAVLMTASVGFLALAAVVSAVSPAIAGAIVAGSIVIFGISYISLGQLIVELGKLEPILGTSGNQASANIPASAEAP